MQAQLSHKQAQSLFLPAADLSLAEPEERALKAHFDQCTDCRAGFERYARVVERLKGVEREKAPPHLASLLARRLRFRRPFGHRGLHLAHLQHRVPVEAIVPVLLAALVAALLFFLAT